MANLRTLLISLIKGMIAVIPETEEERTLRGKFIRLRESLAYKAPELLSGMFADIHTILETYVPIHIDAAQNPPWKKHMQRLWNQAMHDFSEHHTPPQVGSESRAP